MPKLKIDLVDDAETKKTIFEGLNKIRSGENLKTIDEITSSLRAGSKVAIVRKPIPGASLASPKTLVEIPDRTGGVYEIGQGGDIRHYEKDSKELSAGYLSKVKDVIYD
jgi:hypothetical protein